MINIPGGWNVRGLKRPWGETSGGLNVRGWNRGRGESSGRWIIRGGEKKMYKGVNRPGVNHKRGETSGIQIKTGIQFILHVTFLQRASVLTFL